MTQTTPNAPLLQRVAPSLGDEIRGYLQRHREAVEAMIRRGGPEAGLAAAHTWSRAFDGLLCSLYAALGGVTRREGPWSTCTLAAVGSYGRGAIAFASDLDLRLLCPKQETGVSESLAEALLYPLWDANLTVGHQVVTADEMIDLAREDLPTATTLLDWRVVAGDAKSSEGLLRRAFEGLFGLGNVQSFLDRLAQSAGERHERYGGSVYLLEPDVRNGPGGLRDLDVACWAARARYRVRDLKALVALGVLVPREHTRIAEAQEFLFRIRNLLHVHAARRSDRLSFDRQEQLASDLGYGGGGPEVERFMSDYYRHARELERARDMILARAAPPPTRRPHVVRLGRSLLRLGDSITLAHPGALDGEPALALRLYDEAVRRQLPVHDYARDAVARAATRADFCQRLRESEEANRLFVKLCTTAKLTRFKNGSVLGELHDVGLLTAMIPEFLPVVGRVHHDVYHVYTVDAHSVAAVDRLRALVRGDLAQEYPLAARIAAEIGRPSVLYLATLLHDVGKDIGGRNHSERGAELAAVILGRLGFSPEDTREVQHLVTKHLRMYHVATRRDIDDPGTLQAFAREVNGREGLRELYLLTIADVSTTSPTAMNSWKARMLDELLRATESWLGSGAPRSDAQEEKRNGVLGASELSPKERGQLEQFLRAMPERYLTANDVRDIARHARFAVAAGAQPFRVEALASADEHVELAFAADDRPGLLAMVTAALAAARLDVVGAQIYVWTDDAGRARALDLFWVRGGDDAQAVRTQLPRILRDLERLWSHEVAPAELVQSRTLARGWGRRTPTVATEVSFDHQASAHTVLEVITRDRPALLFWLAHTLQDAGLSIAVAKINTEGASVADVFYVTDASGSKIDDPARIEEIRTRITQTIARLQNSENTG
ncbi:MAG: [protein-PII] uridylyltransferase [Polyangiaceae bacterium]|nr:[protein-PII] uridylyltransferase [Polyangiaceae bacterium]